MDEKIIIFYVLLFSNAINLVESTCEKQEVKSTVGNQNCWNEHNGYRYIQKCETKYPIIKKVITCSDMSMNEVVSNIKAETDGNIDITLRVTNSDTAVLSTSTFQNIKKLTWLSLDKSKIQKIIPGAFNLLDHLEELHLDENQLSTITDGLFNSLTLLKTLNLSKNQIQDISDHAFQGVKLTELNLAHNNLSQLRQVLLESLTSLKTLDVSWNELSNVSDFTNVASLDTLNLSHNTITVVDFELFPEKLSKIDLSFNSISEIPNFNTSGASEIILNHNNIGALEKNVNAVLLDVSYNEIETVSADLFGSGLKKLNAAHNLISSLNRNAFLGLFNLEWLLLNNNNLSFIPNSCFKDLRSLTHLDLSRNELTHFAFGTFENLENLQVLNISYNNLKDLQQHTFYSLSSLTDLLFQNNKISDVHVDDLKLQLSKLKTVNLDNNNWSCKKLLYVIHSFKKVSVSFPNGNCWGESNIHGIKCDEILEENDVDRKSDADSDIDDSKLNKFFNEDFTNSTLYKYFNKDFKDTNFFKYLESLNDNTSSANVQKLNFEKFIEELKSNYSDERFEQSAMFNYFNDDFRKSNFFKYLESLKNQAATENKLNTSSLEEQILLFKELVERNTKLTNNSFRQDASMTDMYKYFNEGFKNSTFFRYLEGLNERLFAQNQPESFHNVKVEKYSSEVGRENGYSPNYTAILLFISTMLVVVACVVAISAYLLISRLKKCNTQKKEEVQLL